ADEDAGRGPLTPTAAGASLRGVEGDERDAEHDADDHDQRGDDRADQDRQRRGRIAVAGDLLEVMLLGDELFDDRSHGRDLPAFSSVVTSASVVGEKLRYQ